MSIKLLKGIAEESIITKLNQEEQVLLAIRKGITSALSSVKLRLIEGYTGAIIEGVYVSCLESLDFYFRRGTAYLMDGLDDETLNVRVITLSEERILVQLCSGKEDYFKADYDNAGTAVDKTVEWIREWLDGESFEEIEAKVESVSNQLYFLRNNEALLCAMQHNLRRESSLINSEMDPEFQEAEGSTCLTGINYIVERKDGAVLKVRVTSEEDEVAPDEYDFNIRVEYFENGEKVNEVFPCGNLALTSRQIDEEVFDWLNDIQ